jgi:hypothetical protein
MLADEPGTHHANVKPSSFRSNPTVVLQAPDQPPKSGPRLGGIIRLA